MSAAAFLVAFTLAQGPAPLNRAESVLAAGDTAAAVAVLAELVAGEHEEVGLAAALALEWIGRDARWPEAAERFRRARAWGRSSDDAPASRLLAIAQRLRVGEGRGSDSAAVSNVRRLFDQAPPQSLVEGAAGWVLSLQLLARFERTLVDAIPPAGETRGCPFQRASQCVRVDGVSSRGGMPFAGIVTRDTALAALRRDVREVLMGALHAPWPFSALAGQALLSLEILFGDAETWPVAANAMAQASLPERSRRLAQAALLVFSGDRSAAHELMARSPEWFSPLDTRTEALGPLPDLSPAILWRVAWALYLEPVNERQIVHRARVLASAPIARSFPAIGRMLWLESDSSLLIRYGLPVGIARREAQLRPTGAGVPVVTYVDRRTRETLLRTTGIVAVSPTGEAHPDALSVDLGLAARDTVALSGPSGYVDDHFDTFGPLEHQVVQYFRDGQPLIEIYVTRPEARCDSPEKSARKAQQLSGTGAAPVMGFFLVDDRLGLVRRAVDSVRPGAPRRYTYQLQPQPGVYVFSVEHFDPACRHAARAGYVLSVRSLEQGLALSDIVLSVERRVGGAMRIAGPPRPSALGRLTVRVSEALHLYWEVYGVPAGAVETERFDVEVEVLDLGSRKVAVREIPDVARAVEGVPRSLDMRYRAPIVMGGQPLALGLSIELPPGSEGLHLIRIRLKDLGTGQAAAAQRAFFVTP